MSLFDKVLIFCQGLDFIARSQAYRWYNVFVNKNKNISWGTLYSF
nr:hypothetical protein DGKKSRWO_DGKKSRWO_CDS_0020 [uncultured phage]CAI9752137.1 hypothetical protein CVNMHQAP_CVNMHQAP_CDS_0020 [uncultured phage]